MNKRIALLFITLLYISTLFGCSQENKTTTLKQQNEELKRQVSALEKQLVESVNVDDYLISSTSTPYAESKNASTPISDYKSITFGEHTIIDNVCDFVIYNYEFVEKALPPNTSGYYNYFKSSDGNIYLVFKGEIKNLDSDTLDIGMFSKIFDAEYKYQDKYTYSTVFANAMQSTSTDFYGDTVNPLETKLLYLRGEVPAELQNNPNQIKLNIRIKGKTYTLNMANTQ